MPLAASIALFTNGVNSGFLDGILNGAVSQEKQDLVDEIKKCQEAYTKWQQKVEPKKSKETKDVEAHAKWKEEGQKLGTDLQKAYTADTSYDRKQGGGSGRSWWNIAR